MASDVAQTLSEDIIKVGDSSSSDRHQIDTTVSHLGCWKMAK